MEIDEIKPDFKRRKLQLLTKKPLYLYQTLHKE